MKNRIFLSLMFITNIVSAQDIHLLCTSNDLPGTMTFSIQREKGKLVVRQDSVTMKDREYDADRGYTKIQETPTQFRIEYTNESKNYEYLGILSRLDGKFIEESKRSGKVSTSSIYDCKPTKRMF